MDHKASSLWARLQDLVYVTSDREDLSPESKSSTARAPFRSVYVGFYVPLDVANRLYRRLEETTDYLLLLYDEASGQIPDFRSSWTRDQDLDMETVLGPPRYHVDWTTDLYSDGVTIGKLPRHIKRDAGFLFEGEDRLVYMMVEDTAPTTPGRGDLLAKLVAGLTELDRDGEKRKAPPREQAEPVAKRQKCTHTHLSVVVDSA